MEITEVDSTQHPIRYSTKGRGRTISFPLPLPPAPKKKTRTLYSTGNQTACLSGWCSDLTVHANTWREMCVHVCVQFRSSI